ncbi:MAG: DUF3494 domain-containing protein [Bacteroidetes bacterium]|nr:DUF3494 domain-containing protein [Bacteroidota bacterium]
MKNKLLFIVLSTLSIFYFPNQNFGQAPNLGTVANFVLFTTNGAITNTGSSHLTGHVGSNVGSSTGFGNVDGVMHNQDPASAQATLDLNALYLELDAKVPTSFPGILLGNNQTLNPGVHSSPASATLSNILYLDAQNDPNAIFIFQIDGTFSANANSKVILLNSAQACNVYWKIEGAVSLATGTSMKGSIVANNSAINISASDTLEGRALSLNGAIGVNQLFAYTPLGCGTPVLTGPANPALGTTECYVLFSGIGAVTNTGDTYASGDIGSNSGQANGFNPLFITGTIHVNPDASTAQCATDFNNVYNDLTALPYDIELLYPAQFGNNLVLTPHVYLMNGAVTFTDSLYLNAQENPNAVFVFQVKGAFNTSTLSRVKLINGAQAKNVYWLIDGAVEVNNLSIFNGTIISQGAIKLNSGVKLNGRALTGVGSVTTEAISAFMPTSCSPYTITEPTDQTVCKGTTANFTVNASGSNLTYQWRKGSVDLNNGGNISGVDTETLTISPAGLSDAANNYNVIISGSFTPNDTSEYVTLSIISALSLVKYWKFVKRTILA